MSCTGQEELDFQMVTTLAEKPSTGGKILILQAGMVATLRMVVLVWFTGILAEYLGALMVAEVLLLLSWVGVIIGITC